MEDLTLTNLWSLMHLRLKVMENRPKIWIFELNNLKDSKLNLREIIE